MKKKFFQDLSLKLKLTFLFSFLLLLISTFIFIYIPAKREAFSVKAIEEKTRVIGLMTAYSISPAIVFDDETAVEESFYNARQNKELIYLIVVKEDGQIFKSYNLHKAYDVNYKKNNVDFDLSVVKKEIPIYHQSKKIGSLFIGLSLNDVKKEILETRIVIGIISLMVFLFGLIAIIGISTFLTKPLNNFIGTIKEISSGDLSKRVKISARDEIGLLADSFNEMLQKLQLAYEELENLNKSLENRVSERTRELKSSQERYKTLYEKSPVMQYSIDRQGRIISVSEYWLSKTGYTLEEVIGKKSIDFLSAESRKRGETTGLRDFFKSGYCNDIPLQVVKKNGEIIDVLLSATSEKDNEGNVLRSLTVLVDITEKKKAEEKLRESEERFRSLYENATIGIYRTTPDGKIEMANPALVKMLGHSSFEELSARDLTKEGFNPSDERKYFIEQIEKNGTIIGFESAWTSKDGTVVYIRESAKAIRDSNGKTLYYEGTVEDVTERRQAEEALRESEQLFRGLFNASPYAINLIDPHHPTISWPFVDCNEATCQMNGYTREELIGHSIDILNIAEGTPEERIAFFKKLRKEGIIHTEVVHRHKDGHIFPVEVSTSIVTLGGREMVLGIDQDITDRKRAVELLRESEEKYRGIFENVQDVYFETSINGTILEVSPSIEIISKGLYNRDDLIGKSIDNFYSSTDDRQALFALLKEQTSISDYGIILKNRDGSHVPCSISAKIQFDAHGIPLKLIGSIRDITERKRAEEEIAMLAHSLRSINECVSITDLEDKILFVNESYLKTYGYDKNELIGKNISIVRSLNNPPELVKEILPSTLKGGWQGELWNKRKDGSEFLIYLSTTKINNKDGKAFGLIGVAKDITELKRAEKELIQAKEKAEEMNRIKSYFFASMTHELRTPFVGIQGFAEILAETLTDPDAQEMANAIIHSSERLTDTLNKILSLSRLEFEGAEVQKSDVNFNDLLNDCYKLFVSLASKKDLSFTFIEIDQPLIIKSDEKLLRGIINNLINNAIKYTQRGKIELSSSIEKQGGAEYLRIKVSDTGIGIQKDKQDQIWMAFRQASEGFNRTFEGTGLGLTITKKYVEQLGGTISLDSEFGKGSTFTVELPMERADNIHQFAEKQSNAI